MAHNEIIEKLTRFLRPENPVSEECHAIYLLVQMRKILEHERNDRFLVLKFYCDWTVHIQKDVITPEIRSMMDTVFIAIKREIEQPFQMGAAVISTLAYMPKLREEIRDFLTQHDLPLTLVDTGWISFLSLLVKVLENQPIVKPNAEIEMFCFVPANNRCVAGIIKLKTPLDGHDNYTFAGAY